MEYMSEGQRKRLHEIKDALHEAEFVGVDTGSRGLHEQLVFKKKDGVIVYVHANEYKSDGSWFTISQD